MRQYREAVGDDVDLCIEIHRRLTPTEAVQLGRGIEPYRPYFFEDPVTPDNFDEMACVAENVAIPIATGERFTTIWEFEMLLRRNALQYVRPDVCMVGGISGAKKVAAFAEAHHVGVVPHNPLSPVSTAACLQIAACIPNFALQEYPLGESEPPKSEIVIGAANTTARATWSDPRRRGSASSCRNGRSRGHAPGSIATRSGGAARGADAAGGGRVGDGSIGTRRNMRSIRPRALVQAAAARGARTAQTPCENSHSPPR